jgi:ParB-like chromosome segregation protein Spo0J
MNGFTVARRHCVKTSVCATAEIVVGTRIRKTFTEIDELAASIAKCGLLQPIGIRPDKTLVCGERRLRACMKLGWKTVSVHICNGLDDELLLLEAERDENTCRQPLLPTEALEMQRRLQPKYAEVAARAKSEGVKTGGRGNKKNSGTSCTKVKRDDSARAAHRAAKPTGYSATTLKKVAEVQQAADQDPKNFAPLLEALNQSDCKVDRVHKQMKAVAKQIADKKAAKSAAKVIAKAPENGVFHQDFRSGTDRIPDSSVALIFTDPPYDRESLPLFASLADVADRVLIDGGSLITFCGQYVANDVIAMLGSQLRYFWMCCCMHTGNTAQMREYGIKVKWKPMLWFVKGQFRRDRATWVDDLIESRQEKGLHAWQQSVIEASYYIERLTTTGEMVVDPFCGSGTTAFAAKQLNRKWATFDVDPQAVATARRRLSE